MIKLMKSTFYHEAKSKKALAQFIVSAQKLSMGEECKKFEQDFAEKQGRKFAVLVNSGSSANLILIQALINLGRLKKDDGVGVSAVTWSTNIMPLLQLGLRPMLMDCELETLNVSSAILEKYLVGHKALFLTNVLGFCSDIKQIQDLCSERGIILLEDNCESLGSKTNGQLLGNFSLAATFSFYVGHHISTVEGGMVVTDEEELYDMLVMVRAHGWDRQLKADKQKQLTQEYSIDDFFKPYTFYELAYNVRPTEITGWLGNYGLKYWDEIVERRKNNFKKFNQALTGNSELQAMEVEYMETISNFAMPVLVREKSFFKKYIERFNKEKVEIRPIIAGNIAEHPFYKKNVKTQALSLPNATKVHSQGFYFPNHPELTTNEVNLLTNLIAKP
ncbi:MAG: DegT/DnrJ/EryC1/StrS family aminotransferase [Patescibacteria group bacterium]